MKNILVTIDFNKNEELLIDKAFQLAESFNSKLWLMHIAAPDPDFVGYEVGPQYIRDSRATEEVLRKNSLPVIFRIPYSMEIQRSYSKGIPMIRTIPWIEKKLQKLYEDISNG